MISDSLAIHFLQGNNIHGQSCKNTIYYNQQNGFFLFTDLCWKYYRLPIIKYPCWWLIKLLPPFFLTDFVTWYIWFMDFPHHPHKCWNSKWIHCFLCSIMCCTTQDLIPYVEKFGLKLIFDSTIVHIIEWCVRCREEEQRHAYIPCAWNKLLNLPVWCKYAVFWHMDVDRYISYWNLNLKNVYSTKYIFCTHSTTEFSQDNWVVRRPSLRCMCTDCIRANKYWNLAINSLASVDGIWRHRKNTFRFGR